MRVLYETNSKGVTAAEITEISWLDGYVTFKKSNGEQMRIYFGDFSDFELMIAVDKVYDLRNRGKKQEVPTELPQQTVPEIITVQGEDDAMPYNKLKEMWRTTDVLRRGFIYNILPGAYRCLVCDEYVRSDVANYAMDLLQRFKFEKTSYEFQGLYAVASRTLSEYMSKNYRYFWDLCRDGLNTKINATFSNAEILAMLNEAYKEET